MSTELDTMPEDVDTIVIQALTRGLKDTPVKEIEEKIKIITEKAAKKSKNVVIGTH